ncbi:TH1 family protein [Planoprotostelium fungivorum]|uniref:TH1 family protein n=1 Tax=Planoprotostelium fungivorum TaxID=1890364 RepID=A0A2P6N6A7_9EUKA|nr:TH1 family protein [Planoprotostelium fungivorum]
MDEDGKIEDPLDKLQMFLSEPDSVMEPQVSVKMQEYFASGGKPEVAVQMLTENYRGFAQMSSLVSNWLCDTGMDQPSIDGMVLEEMKTYAASQFDPKRADDVIFSKGVPVWLDEMISVPAWRNLIYTLAESHRNCNTLDYAITKIMEQGFETELSTLATASTYFTVFARSFKKSLLELVELDEVSLVQNLPQFRKMCCQSEHTYLYSQYILHSLYANRPLHNLRRLSQEIERGMEARPVVQNISFYLTNVSDHPQVAASISSMLSDRASNPSDVLKLHSAYSSDHPPPAEHLRHPALLEILTVDLFNPFKPVNVNYINKYIYIVAYAVSIQDPSQKDDFRIAMKGLEMVCPVCMKNPAGPEMNNLMDELLTYVNIPVVARGVLSWSARNLSDEEHYGIISNTSAYPYHLQLMRQITRMHPLLHPLVLDILETSLQKNHSWDTFELKRQLMDNLIYLMHCGPLSDVIQSLEKMNSKLDPQLINHFLLQDFIEAMLYYLSLPSTTDAARDLKESKRSLFAFLEEIKESSDLTVCPCVHLSCSSSTTNLQDRQAEVVRAAFRGNELVHPWLSPGNKGRSYGVDTEISFGNASPTQKRDSFHNVTLSMNSGLGSSKSNNNPFSSENQLNDGRRNSAFLDNSIKRVQVARACSHCRRTHAGCGDERPCKRCTQNGLDCTDSPRKRRCKSPADSTNTSPIMLSESPSAQDPDGGLSMSSATDGAGPQAEMPNFMDLPYTWDDLSMQQNPLDFLLSNNTADIGAEDLINAGEHLSPPHGSTDFSQSLIQENQRLTQRAKDLEQELEYFKSQQRRQTRFGGGQKDVSISVWSTRSDGDHLLTEYNDQFRDLIGFPDEELERLSLKQLICGSNEGITGQKTAKIRTTQGVIEVHFNSYPIINSKNQPKYYILHFILGNK